MGNGRQLISATSGKKTPRRRSEPGEGVGCRDLSSDSVPGGAVSLQPTVPHQVRAISEARYLRQMFIPSRNISFYLGTFSCKITSLRVCVCVFPARKCAGLNPIWEEKNSYPLVNNLTCVLHPTLSEPPSIQYPELSPIESNDNISSFRPVVTGMIS